MAGRRNHYREANPDEIEAHPVDEEVERRLRHRTLRRRIIAAQGRVMAALGERWHLYLRLEELVGQRHGEREEARFNVGFEHGLVRGRADALAAMLRNQGGRGRALAAGLAQLATSAGLEPPRARPSQRPGARHRQPRALDERCVGVRANDRKHGVLNRLPMVARVRGRVASTS